MFAPMLPPVVNPKNRGTHKHSVLKELRQLERRAHEMAMSDDTPKQCVAQLMRAFVECEKQRNAIKMKPTPKPVEVDVHGKPVGRGRRGGISRPSIPFDPGAAQSTPPPAPPESSVTGS
jgi:hypothetical protein